MTNTPPEATNVVAISAGQVCNLALRADGRVVQWGAQSWGWTNGSPNYPNAVAIGAGCFHGLMLLKDGTPQMTVQPWDQTVTLGEASSFTTKVVGKQSMTYQWEFNEVAIEGATNQTLEIQHARVADEGSYSVKATNPMGVISSRKAKLVVEKSISPIQLSATALSGGGCVLRVSGPIGLEQVIQASNDLRTWSDIKTNTPASAVWEFADSETPVRQRYYRMRLVP